MKLLAGVFATSTHALSDAEFAKFGCREGTFAQYANGENTAAGAYEWTEYADPDSGNYEGCHPDQGNGRRGCMKTDLQCSMATSEVTANTGLVRQQYDFNSIPDHNAWGLTPNGLVQESNYSYRLPKAAILLSEAEGVAQGAGTGIIGFAVNGVPIYKPYNSNCCDAIWDELSSMDFCVGHPNQNEYHYHFHAYGNYDKCLMSCTQDEQSDLVGIALDGFAFYASVQHYSASEGKVYIDPSNCSDCQLMQLDSRHTDRCGGIEVADGNADEGTQYRYIFTNLYPYGLQCWRGDISKSQLYNENNGNYRKISNTNKCGVDSEGIEGGTWGDDGI